MRIVVNADVIDTVISGNRATTYGGGIDISGRLILTRTTVTGNTAGIAGGGIHTESGTVTLVDSTVTGYIPDDCVGC